MTKKCPFCCTTQKGHGIRIFRVPWPIPRGLLVLTSGRSSDSKVIASYPFPFSWLYVCSHIIFAILKTVVLIRHSLITATRSYRTYTCFPFHVCHTAAFCEAFSHTGIGGTRHTWNQVRESLTQFVLSCKEKNMVDKAFSNVIIILYHFTKHRFGLWNFIMNLTTDFYSFCCHYFIR